MEVLGIDIGGTGMKAAIVDTETGTFITERYRVMTPHPATPESMIAVILDIIDNFKYSGKVGICFPAIVKNNVILTANNIDNSWIGVNLKERLDNAGKDCEYIIHNDADMAGLAEAKLGAGRDVDGKVMTITIGTGLGSGLFFNGKLIPNLEIGSLQHNGEIIENYVSKKARMRDDLSWKTFGKRFNFFLKYVEHVIAPDLIILGGGYSKKYDKYEEYIDVATPLELAHFKNHAGIIGAALSTVE